MKPHAVRDLLDAHKFFCHKGENLVLLTLFRILGTAKIDVCLIAKNLRASFLGHLDIETSE